MLLELHGLVARNVFSSAEGTATHKADVPMRNPLEAPENRPSVIRHVESPRPAPIRAPVGPANPTWFPSFLVPSGKTRTKHLEGDVNII